MYLDFSTWMPDVDPHTPGVIVDCQGLRPTQRGHCADSSLTANEQLITLSADPAGAFTFEAPGNATPYMMVGAGSRLFRSNGSSGWTTASGSGVSFSAATAAVPWRFAPVGDSLVAVHAFNPIQVATVPQTFSGASTITAAHIASASGFAVIGNYSESSTLLTDGWRTCAIFNPSSWTLNAATQAVAGRLRDTGGPITAMRGYRDDIIAFKARAMHRGTYQGPPLVWSWQVISRNVGCFSPECIVEVQDTLYWWDFNGCWMFDGSRPRPVPNAPVSWMQATHDPQSYYLWKGQYDQKDRVIRWYFRSSAESDVLVTNYGVTFHPETGRWGRNDQRVQAALQATTSVTNRNPEIRGAVIQDRVLKTYDGPAVPATLKTGFLGDQERLTLIRNTRLRYTDAPTTATATEYWRNNTGLDVTTGDTIAEFAGKFDFSNEAKWHQIQYSFTGSMEVQGQSVELAEGAR